MILFHGSPAGNLKVLMPQVSEHNKPYIYFSSDPVVATFYMAHIVDKPYNWYPYGFTKEHIPVYTECYPHALRDVYQGKKGYLYSCTDVPGIENPTSINCACVCEKPVEINGSVVVEDVYEQLLRYESGGQLVIRRYETLDDGRISAIRADVASEIRTYGLYEKPEADYSRFLKKHFPEVWDETIRRVERTDENQ